MATLPTLWCVFFGRISVHGCPSASAQPHEKVGTGSSRRRAVWRFSLSPGNMRGSDVIGRGAGVARCRPDTVGAHVGRAAATDDALQRGGDAGGLSLDRSVQLSPRLSISPLPDEFFRGGPRDLVGHFSLRSAVAAIGGFGRRWSRATPGPSLPGTAGPLGAPPTPVQSLRRFQVRTLRPPQPPNPNSYGERNLNGDDVWSWQILPTGLMYPAYLAGNREARLGSEMVYIHHLGTVLDSTIGGRVGLLAMAPTPHCCRRAGSLTLRRPPFRGWTPTATWWNATINSAFP